MSGVGVGGLGKTASVLARVASGLGALGLAWLPAGAPIVFAFGPKLPPSPQWLPHFPPAAWEIFPMEACPSPPYFNKSLEEGQGIPPGSSYTSQPVPHLLFPPPLGLARPGRAAGSQVLAEGGVGAQPMPRPAASSSFILTGKQGASAGGECPAACDPGTGKECLDPPATLWSGGARNCQSQSHP